jgi:DNA-binding XRE family transcriptional regulator
MESKLLREVEESRRITGEDLAKRVGASESGEEPKR